MSNSNSFNIVHIYWFSGAGNTLRATLALAERFRELGMAVELKAIEQSDPLEIDPNALFGIAFPTHCFTIPEIVRRFAEQLPNVVQTPAFMLNTVGATSSGGVRGPMKRILSGKGFSCLGAKELLMPDSFFALFHGKTAEWMIGKALIRVRIFADRLVSGQTTWRRIPWITDWYAAFLRGFFACRNLHYPYFRYPTVGARQKTCVRCGLCAKYCPVGALSMQSLEKANPESDAEERKKERWQTMPLKGTPTPNLNCTLCLRCVAICPHNAMRHRFMMFPPYRAKPSKELRILFDENEPVSSFSPDNNSGNQTNVH
ncbi:MAG: EFR1 family ferrodoxin [Planctomycetaceae bacterium]|nr:EFR1 family ferrodoxin [Planctomycetaceae bacterium]